jgi:hypothetical protein
MRLAAAAVALLALVAPQNAAQGQRADSEIVLNLPRPIGAGETAFIEVQVGPIGRAQIEVTTDTGRPLGTLSPFGARAGQDAGTFTLPVPPSALRDGRIAVRLTVRQGDSRRPPTVQEVRGVRLSIGGAR